MNGLRASQKLESVLNVNQGSGIEKKCSRCKENKQLYKFNKKKTKDGWSYVCKKCRNARDRQIRNVNLEKYREKNRNWRKLNPEKVREMNRNHEGSKPRPKKRIIGRRLNEAIARAIRRALKDNKGGRYWEDLLDFTLVQLKKHLKKYFQSGMTWENYGKWHIDHIVPISVFNFEKSEDTDFKRCWALKNLQPLWAKENISKHNNLKKPFQPSLIFK